jgi:RimJ/RimL family protein N-acetyltransferase
MTSAPFDPRVPAPITLTTDRLVLRPWRETDADAFAAMNADPVVMAHYPAPQTREESDASFGRVCAHFADRGFGLWAAEEKATGAFIGFVGLAVPKFEAHFTPCVEIGWRLLPHAWGKGYATEGARASLAFGFGTLGLAEIVALTRPENTRSIAVMERLGMTRNPADDFEYEFFPPAFRKHVLYRLRAPGVA